jgi:hypothetical protein
MHSSTRLIVDRHIRSKIPRVVAGSLTGIHNAMVKYLFVDDYHLLGDDAVWLLQEGS